MRVIVIGGGVAGAATAVALRRIGVEVTAYEAHAGPAGRLLDNLLVPVFFRWFDEKATAWLHTHDLGTLPVPGRTS